MKTPDGEKERHSQAILEGRAPRGDESWSLEPEFSDSDSGQDEIPPYFDPEALQEAAAWRASKITKGFIEGIQHLRDQAYRAISEQKTETAAAMMMGEHMMALKILEEIEGSDVAEAAM